MTSKIAENAVKALLYEVSTCPKPGLVDPMSSGPHPDMDVYLFIDSSLSLEDYFKQAVSIGQNFDGNNLIKMFDQLRAAEIKAEKKMLESTHGVNTHKGAIFALGIFVCARSYQTVHGGDLFEIIKAMTNHLVERDLGHTFQQQTKLTAGEKQFAKYGLGGARAEAEAGYPVIKETALPFLKTSTGSIKERLLDTLMKIATVTDDSNLIKRAGEAEIVAWLHKVARHYLDLGGYKTKEGKKYLQELNAIFLKKNYSLGGCADLLIVTIFLGLEFNYL